MSCFECEWKILLLVLNYDLASPVCPELYQQWCKNARIDMMWWMSSSYGFFFLSICCWPLSEAGGWACWTCALIWYKCYFLKNFENPFPLKQRRGRRRVLHDWTAVMPPTWAKEEHCNFWAKYSCCLPLPKDWWLHIILVCHTPLTLVLVQASSFGICFLPLSCSCIKEYLWKWGLINHTRILNENWKLCREMYWRFIIHHLWNKMFVRIFNFAKQSVS